MCSFSISKWSDFAFCHQLTVKCRFAGLTEPVHTDIVRDIRPCLVENAPKAMRYYDGSGGYGVNQRFTPESNR